MMISCQACKGLGFLRSITEYRENYTVTCNTCNGTGTLYVEEVQLVQLSARGGSSD